MIRLDPACKDIERKLGTLKGLCINGMTICSFWKVSIIAKYQLWEIFVLKVKIKVNLPQSLCFVVHLTTQNGGSCPFVAESLDEATFFCPDLKSFASAVYCLFETREGNFPQPSCLSLPIKLKGDRFFPCHSITHSTQIRNKPISTN